MLLEYIKTLRSAKTGSGPGSGPGLGFNFVIQLDPKGFPIMPQPSSWEKFSKDDLEWLYCKYLTHHYCR